MPWSYFQNSGALESPDGHAVAHGYSGRDVGLNNGQLQSHETIGPIPRGGYTIGPAFHHALAGPLTMRLVPDPSNAMFGRDGFMIHGDTSDHAINPRADNSASHGCIILAHDVRELIDASDDRRIIVIA